MAIEDIPLQKLTDEQLAERRVALVDALCAILPQESVLSEYADVVPYECDGLSVYAQVPLVVVLPESIQQVQEVVRLCKRMQVPLVARGAGTGLSGGATPHPEGVLLGFGKMSNIIDIDAPNRCAVLQPGVRNQFVSEQTRSLGLYFAPDPSSQIACSIGGNMAENAGGLHCLKYGLSVNNIIGAKVVLDDGSLVDLGGKRLHSAGVDWLALFCGSEGLLGVVVEVTVRLLPIPVQERLMLAGFGSVRDAADCVAAIIAEGILPAGLEMMDSHALLATDDFAQCGYPRDAQAILLCEVDGCQSALDEQIEQVTAIARKHCCTSLTVSESEEQRLKLWLGRKSAFPAVGRLSPDYYCMDGTIPRRYIGEILEKIEALSTEYGLVVVNVFHAGDGNLHPLILYDAAQEGELERCEKLGGEILELCIQYGGTITGEHGVGVEKIGHMCHQFNLTELDCFHQVKSQFDSDGLLNPGKAIPTLNRCAEFGHLHVHNNQLPHPDIERF